MTDLSEREAHRSVFLRLAELHSESESPFICHHCLAATAAVGAPWGTAGVTSFSPLRYTTGSTPTTLDLHPLAGSETAGSRDRRGSSRESGEEHPRTREEAGCASIDV